MTRRSELPAVPTADIARMILQQRGWCWYCGTDLAKDGYHVDHVVPLAMNGKHEPSNWKLACPWCNRSKGAKSAEEFIKETIEDHCSLVGHNERLGAIQRPVYWRRVFDDRSMRP